MKLKHLPLLGLLALPGCIPGYQLMQTANQMASTAVAQSRNPATRGQAMHECTSRPNATETEAAGARLLMGMEDDDGLTPHQVQWVLCERLIDATARGEIGTPEWLAMIAQPLGYKDDEATLRLLRALRKPAGTKVSAR
jgi:hypothetical protein